MLPAIAPGAAAADTYEVYVGGVGMNSGDWLANGAGAASDTQPEGGYAHYADGVLTLNGYVYSGEGHGYGDTEYTAAVYSESALEVVLVGNSSLTNTTAGYGEGITVWEDDLTISGEGSLEIMAAVDGIYLENGEVSISGGTVGITANGDGIEAPSVSISDGTVTIYVSGDYSYGIYASNDVNIGGGTVDVTVIGKYGRGICGNNDINVGGGTVKITAEDYSSYGIYASNDVNIVGGEVDITSENASIYAGTNVNISGGTMKLVSTGSPGISANNGDISIVGGTIEINESHTGINAFIGDVSISGGETKLTVEAGQHAIRAYSGGSITLPNYLEFANLDGDTVYSIGEDTEVGTTVVDESGNIVTALQVRVKANHEWNVWVGGVRMQNDKWLANDASELSDAQPEGGYAFFRNGALTLNGYEYSGEGYYSGRSTAAVYSKDDLTVVLEGNSRLTNTAENGDGITVIAAT